MPEFRDFEQQVLRVLASSDLSADLLDDVCAGSLATRCEYSGVGYFITASDPRLPLERKVLTRPTIHGVGSGLECGFLVFLGEHELLFECHGYGDEMAPSFRDNPVAVTVVQDPGV